MSIYDQTDWYISFSTGNDSNDGTISNPLKTPNEWTKRTAGITPTVLPTIHILDVSGAPNIECAYTSIPYGLRILGTATTISGAPNSVTSWRSESLSGSGISRAITKSSGTDWTSLENINGQLPRIRCVAKNVCFWGGKVESNTIVEVGPAYAVDGYSFAYPNIGSFTELANGDTIICETLPIVEQILISGTSIPSGKYLVIENLETNGGDQNFTSTQGEMWSGAGHVIYLNCGIGSAGNVGTIISFVNCRMDDFSIYTGDTAIFGGVFFWNFNQGGGQCFLNGALFAGVNMSIYDGHCDLHAPTGITNCSDFGTEAGILISRKGSLVLRNIIYGSNNDYGIHCQAGGSVSYSNNHKPILVGETDNVKLDDALLTLDQTPAINAATSSKIVLFDAPAVIVIGKSVALSTSGTFNWNVTLAPIAHIIASDNCSVTLINDGADTSKYSLEFVPTSGKTLTLSGVTFATFNFTQAALTTLCTIATRITIDIVNRRGALYVDNFNSYSA